LEQEINDNSFDESSKIEKTNAPASNHKPYTLPASFLGSTGLGKCQVQPPEHLSPDSSLIEILVFARQKQATDIHISSEHPILFRIFSKLVKQTEKCLSKMIIESLVVSILTQEQLNAFQSKGDLELIYVVEGAGRFRITLMKKRLGLDLTVRLIPMQIPTFEQLGIPESCKELMKWTQGMILIAGPIGCGKTTTLSTLIEMVNQQRKEHIITIEDPIEIVFESKLAQISQREINLHTLSQDNALRAALREDPDILVVSELRDLSTIQLAATAAETGHLVLGTMNTNDSIQTILRIINSFSPDERSIVQNMISESLRGIICQQLVPKKDGSGVVPVYEALIVNNAVSNLIRKGNLDQLITIITTGRAEGMIPFDASLRNLYESGIISGSQAYERCFNKNEFEVCKNEN